MLNPFRVSLVQDLDQFFNVPHGECSKTKKELSSKILIDPKFQVSSTSITIS